MLLYPTLRGYGDPLFPGRHQRKKQMNLFIVSHNPLFSEVLSEMLRPNLALEIFCVDPEMAQEAVLGICPEVIFIDQAISPELRIQIMGE
jgi:hypothetical protein